MSKTNFDRYLDRHLANPSFARRFAEAGESWELAMQLATLREQAGLTQAELARRLQTSQQQISRLESPEYEGHSLRMIRRVAAQLQARVKIVLEPLPATNPTLVRESQAAYKTKAKAKPK